MDVHDLRRNSTAVYYARNVLVCIHVLRIFSATEFVANIAITYRKKFWGEKFWQPIFTSISRRKQNRFFSSKSSTVIVSYPKIREFEFVYIHNTQLSKWKSLLNVDIFIWARNRLNDEAIISSLIWILGNRRKKFSHGSVGKTGIWKMGCGRITILE